MAKLRQLVACAAGVLVATALAGCADDGGTPVLRVVPRCPTTAAR